MDDDFEKLLSMDEKSKTKGPVSDKQSPEPSGDKSSDRTPSGGEKPTVKPKPKTLPPKPAVKSKPTIAAKPNKPQKPVQKPAVPVKKPAVARKPSTEKSKPNLLEDSGGKQDLFSGAADSDDIFGTSGNVNDDIFGNSTSAAKIPTDTSDIDLFSLTTDDSKGSKNLDADDILNYIQANTEQNSDDLDLFS